MGSLTCNSKTWGRINVQSQIQVSTCREINCFYKVGWKLKRSASKWISKRVMLRLIMKIYWFKYFFISRLGEGITQFFKSNSRVLFSLAVMLELKSINREPNFSWWIMNMYVILCTQVIWVSGWCSTEDNDSWNCVQTSDQSLP